MSNNKSKSNSKSRKQKEPSILMSIVGFFFEDEIKAARWLMRFKRALIVIGVPILAIILTYIVAYRLSAHTVTFTVSEKPPRIYNATAYPNLIYTDKGVYQNTDSFIFFKFRSSDVYNQIEAKRTYTCKVAGWRVGFLSWYRNILDCEGFKYY